MSSPKRKRLPRAVNALLVNLRSLLAEAESQTDQVRHVLGSVVLEPDTASRTHKIVDSLHRLSVVSVKASAACKAVKGALDGSL